MTCSKNFDLYYIEQLHVYSRLFTKQLKRLDEILKTAYPGNNFPEWRTKFDKAKFITGPWQTENECGLSVLRFLQYYNGDKIQCHVDKVTLMI